MQKIWFNLNSSFWNIHQSLSNALEEGDRGLLKTKQNKSKNKTKNVFMKVFLSLIKLQNFLRLMMLASESAAAAAG